MKYLYGDATESPLDINYLDLLRDVLDFGASVMLAHGNITQHRDQATKLESEARVEREQLEKVNGAVEKTLSACKQRVTTHATKSCVDSIRAVAAAEIKRAEAGVQGRLASELGKVNEAVAREQANNHKRLEALLLKHDLPDCALWVNARFHPKTNGYVAELIGKAACDVAFVIDLEIPPDHLLNEPLRIDRIAPGLTIKVPEKSGWVRKSVKMRPHKLAREYVVSVSHSTKRTTIKLRNALHEADSGYDLIFGSKNRVAVARIAKGSEADPFEPDAEDKAALLAFYGDVDRALKALENSRRALRGAQLDATPLSEHADATVLVRRLVQQMAPVVHEISSHSLSPEELVLKRVLADDRREEIFLAKADLRAKLDPLPESLREVFAPLRLDVAPVDVTGPPPPVAKTVIMEPPAAAGPRQGNSPSAPAGPTKVIGLYDEPTTEVAIADGVATADVDQAPLDAMAHVDDASTTDEALPLPLSTTAVIPMAAIRTTLQPGAGPTQTAGTPPPLPINMPQGVTMPSPTRKTRDHRSAPPVPPSNRGNLPKPSSPPPRRSPPAKPPTATRVGGTPGADIQNSDSVDVQLDELLKSSE